MVPNLSATQVVLPSSPLSSHSHQMPILLLKEVIRVQGGWSGGWGSGGGATQPAAICLLCSDLPGEAGRQLLMQDAGRASCLASGFGEEILQSHWLSSCRPSEEPRFLQFSRIKVKRDSSGYLCSERSCPEVYAARGLLGAPELPPLPRARRATARALRALSPPLHPHPCLQFG